ncbi:MAG: 4-(cytidine 5'-diphospho)-2-C-methyl-D-erythritol kinase [Bacteroidetes bacterium]|nr:4-(cytidine 5'-diphospho)-2-C-methyl-D-erythritol kinase [Bacteroidota bacterium]
MPTRHCRAHAKINIGLEVLGKRPDGFHEIRSVFVPISLADNVTVDDAAVDSVICIPAVTDTVESNLAYRAMQAIRSRAHAYDRTSKITVEKHIPSGGGLGGGSSDAAAVLTLLRDHWSLTLTASDLWDLALQLGSDVPFFLRNRPSLVEGRGEHVTDLDGHLPYHILVVLPGIHVSTADAYAALGRGPLTEAETTASRRSQFLATVQPLLTSTPLLEPPSVTPANDFEAVVFDRHPSLATIKEELYALGATYAAMSGSGSTMYGLFATEEGGKAAVERFGELTAYLCRPL